MFLNEPCHDNGNKELPPQNLRIPTNGNQLGKKGDARLNIQSMHIFGICLVAFLVVEKNSSIHPNTIHQKDNF